ncbi:MAG: hypothetical protein ABUS56_08840 [Acidobacteriota bacterium]
MPTLKVLVLGLSFLLAGGGPATAEVALALEDGHVTLTATNATVRQILAEWARIGQTKIVNAERIPGGPLTLQFQSAPEEEVLDILLRTVGGYMAARRATDAPHLSRFDRIMVMPTAPAPRAPAAPPASAAFQQPSFQQPGFQQQGFPQPGFQPPAPGQAQPHADDDPTQAGPSIAPPARGAIFQTFSQPPVANPQGAAQPVVVDPQAPPAFVPSITSPTGAPRPGMVVQPLTPAVPVPVDQAAPRPSQ